MNSRCPVPVAELSLRRCSCVIAAFGQFAAATALAALLVGCAEQVPKAGRDYSFRDGMWPGTLTKIDFFTNLNPDCTFIDYGTIRTLETPSHGALTFERITDFALYYMNNSRFDCGKQRVPGTVVRYQSDPGYVGRDTAKIEEIAADGELRTITYRLFVGKTAEDQGLKEVSVPRTSVSGSIQKVGFQTVIDPDCSSLGETRIRVTRAPSHGTLKIQQGEDYAEFPKSNPRFDCNKQKVPGSLIYYQSEAGYTGQDSARVEVIYPQGLVKSVLYSITVR